MSSWDLLETLWEVSGELLGIPRNDFEFALWEVLGSKKFSGDDFALWELLPGFHMRVSEYQIIRKQHKLI